MDVVCTYNVCNTLGTSVGKICAHNGFEGAMFLLELPAESFVILEKEKKGKT